MNWLWIQCVEFIHAPHTERHVPWVRSTKLQVHAADGATAADTCREANATGDQVAAKTLWLAGHHSRPFSPSPSLHSASYQPTIAGCIFTHAWTLPAALSSRHFVPLWLKTWGPVTPPHQMACHSEPSCYHNDSTSNVLECLLSCVYQCCWFLIVGIRGGIDARISTHTATSSTLCFSHSPKLTK